MHTGSGMHTSSADRLLTCDGHGFGSTRDYLRMNSRYLLKECTAKHIVSDRLPATPPPNRYLNRDLLQDQQQGFTSGINSRDPLVADVRLPIGAVSNPEQKAVVALSAGGLSRSVSGFVSNRSPATPLWLGLIWSDLLQGEQLRSHKD